MEYLISACPKRPADRQVSGAAHFSNDSVPRREFWQRRQESAAYENPGESTLGSILVGNQASVETSKMLKCSSIGKALALSVKTDYIKSFSGVSLCSSPFISTEVAGPEPVTFLKLATISFSRQFL